MQLTSLINPLTNPVFMPVALTVAGALVVFLAYTLFMERRNLSRLMETSLFPRWLSSAILAPLMLVCVFSGPLALTFLITLFGLVSVWEFARMTGLSTPFKLAAYAFGAAVPALTALAPLLVPPALMLCVLTMGSIAVFKFRAVSAVSGGPLPPVLTPQTAPAAPVLHQAVTAFFAVAYAPLLGSFAIYISAMDGGAGILLSLISAVALSDTCAFLCGKAFGKRKMAPHVSPNTTWAGAVGNTLGAYLGFSIVLIAGPALPLAVLLVLPALIAAASIMGDLFESVVKRTVGVKDAGTWLPGFGGILDRIDSLLFVLPVSYMVLWLAV